MSVTTEQTNAAPSESAPKKKSKLMLIVIILVVLAGAGGGAFFFLRGGTTAAAAAKSKTAKSKKVSSDEEESTEETSTDKTKGANKKGEKADALSLPDDSDVKQVTELQPFIVNLADKDGARYLRLTISLGLGESKEAEKPDPLFTTRVRNAMLAVLTTKTSEEVLSSEGKVALRKELLSAAQTVSETPKVEAIYITDFIIQL